MRWFGVRNWLTPRCVLIVLLLGVAPGAALAHLLITWVPGRVMLARLDRTVRDGSGRLDALCAQNRALGEQSGQLERARAELDEPGHRAWLPRRDRDGVFDRLAEAFRDDHVSLEQMTFGEPGLYAAVDRRLLLACERVTINCSGDYAALARCLDRVAALGSPGAPGSSTYGLPLRITRLAWISNTSALRLTLQLEVPFAPDEALRTALAEAARLGDTHES
jgi:hypothetical protein